MHSLTTRGSASSQRFSLFPKTISGEKYSAPSLPGQLVGSINSEGISSNDQRVLKALSGCKCFCAIGGFSEALQKSVL